MIVCACVYECIWDKDNLQNIRNDAKGQKHKNNWQNNKTNFDSTMTLKNQEEIHINCIMFAHFNNQKCK